MQRESVARTASASPAETSRRTRSGPVGRLTPVLCVFDREEGLRIVSDPSEELRLRRDVHDPEGASHDSESSRLNVRSGPEARALALALLLMASGAFAAAPEAPPAPSVVRTVAVVSYGAGAISTAELQGTDLAPKASGTVRVAARQGTARLTVSVRDLPPATSFGPEFLTYVVWAVQPDGRARNLGEIAPKQGRGWITITTQVPAFGLVVTVEPYFAAGTPSELVVLRNHFPGKATRAAASAEARFETFARATFGGTGVAMPDAKAGPPLEVYQARNAVRIAARFGAASFAADDHKRASDALKEAETLWQGRKQRKMAPGRAREAVQSAEAARAAAVQKIVEVRAAAQQAEAAARADEAQARAEAERARAEEAQAHALGEAQRRAEAEANAARAESLRRQAEEEKHSLRARLLQQFNLILETRDSARGLIVNLGDVLFDVDKFTLRPEAREKLAKLSGVLLANAGLKLEVEGHTDATGSDEYNLTLSENRAGSVRDYLVAQGVPADAVTARGFGKTRPVAPNDTAPGRQKNRRVEIVVSGDVIGTGVAAEREGVAPQK